MISFLEKWLYTEETGPDPSSEFSLNESEAGDWLLIDVELINSEGEFLSDYVVVPVIRQEDESPLARQKNKGVSKSLKNIKKCQKIFHGKMISRICARGLAHPYCIERPLGFKAAISEAEDMRNVERLKQLGFWLETMMIKVPRSLSTLGNSLTVSRVRVQRLANRIQISCNRFEEVLLVTGSQKLLSGYYSFTQDRGNDFSTMSASVAGDRFVTFRARERRAKKRGNGEAKSSSSRH